MYFCAASRATPGSFIHSPVTSERHLGARLCAQCWPVAGPQLTVAVMTQALSTVPATGQVLSNYLVSLLLRLLILIFRRHFSFPRIVRENPT